MGKIWNAICRALDALLPRFPLTPPPNYWPPPPVPSMPDFDNLGTAMRAVDAAPDYVSERTKREFAAGRRTTYVNSEGKLISFRPEKLAAAQQVPSFEFPDHARIPERPAHFGKRRVPPAPPRDNISTMVTEADLHLLARIREIRLKGGSPCVIDFLRQTDLGKVIAYTVETADANGELAGMAFLRAWSEGRAAAAAELRAYLLDEKPY